MSQSAYFDEMRVLALNTRAKHKVSTDSINLRLIRSIYKAEGIKIDPWDLKNSRIKAAYFCDEDDFSVMVNKNLPLEPRLFALVHELKHHYTDRDKIQKGQFQCGAYNANKVVEIGAEVFAAEFIYPEVEMRELALRLDISCQTCTREKIVEFKRACPAPVSYKFIVKRFEWFRLCVTGQFKQEQFQKLEEALHGVPIYKQPWFQQYRARKSQAKATNAK